MNPSFIVFSALNRHFVAQLVGGTGSAIPNGVSFKAAKNARKWVRKRYGAGCLVGTLWEGVRLKSLGPGHVIEVRKIR